MNLLVGSVKKYYFQLLVAAVGSALVASIFGIVDAMMVGQYEGPNGVAALSIFSPVWNIVYSLGILSGIGGSVLYANRKGSNEDNEANQYFTASVMFGIVLAIAAFLGISLFHNSMFRFFGANDTLLELANTYLSPIRFAIPCCVFSNILSAYLRNDGDANLAMKAVLMAGAFNVIGDYVCIFVLDMGIFGAGLATTIAQYVSIGTMLTHFLKKKNTLSFVPVKRRLDKLAMISQIGFSTAISDISMGIITILFNRSIMKYLGVDALSVYGIIAQIVPLVQCCAYGAGQALQPIVSQNFGADQLDRVRECLKYGLGTSFVFGIVWIILVAGFPNAFVYLFMTPTQAVLEMAPSIMRSYSVAFLFVPFTIFSTYYFQSILKPGLALFISLARGVVISGLLILLLPVLFGPNALWFAMPISEVLVAIFCVISYKKIDLTVS